MRRPYQILMPLLGLFLVRVDLTDLSPLHMEVKVLKIYDGDTVLVSHGSYRMKVRLSKIDSPEKGQPYLNHHWDAGHGSKKCFEKILKTAGRTFLRIERQDIYGRILGDINEISLDLIRNGCTTLYPHAEFDSKKSKFIYLQALKKAKENRLGLWYYGGFRQPKLWRKSNRRISHLRPHRPAHFR